MREPACGAKQAAFVARDVRTWPVSPVPVVQLFGSDRSESGHPADIVDRSIMTDFVEEVGA
jgi:hypothetical protein